MQNNKQQDESNISYSVIFVTSILLGIIFGYTSYYILQDIYFSRFSENIDKFFILVAQLICVLSISLFYLIGITVGRSFKVHKRTRELNIFRQFTESINNAHQELEIFQYLHKFLRVLLNDSQINLFYNKIEVHSNANWDCLLNEPLSLCKMSPDLCPCIVKNIDCIVNDITTDIRCAYQHNNYISGSYICLAFEIDGHVSFIIQLYNRRKNFFSEDIINNLRSYVETISPVIEKKRKISVLNKEAFTDKLTRVYNRSYLEKYLTLQIASTIQSKSDLSLMIIDIDHFKKVNDTYGHDAGDVVLTKFARSILKCLRANDILARFGGEEFVVVLPSTNLDSATTIAERIRDSVENERMPVLEGVPLPSITCSLGISSIPLYADSITNLIKTADIALYNAKSEGRNRFVTYSHGMKMVKK